MNHFYCLADLCGSFRVNQLLMVISLCVLCVNGEIMPNMITNTTATTTTTTTPAPATPSTPTAVAHNGTNFDAKSSINERFIRSFNGIWIPSLARQTHIRSPLHTWFALQWTDDDEPVVRVRPASPYWEDYQNGEKPIFQDVPSKYELPAVAGQPAGVLPPPPPPPPPPPRPAPPPLWPLTGATVPVAGLIPDLRRHSSNVLQQQQQQQRQHYSKPSPQTVAPTSHFQRTSSDQRFRLPWHLPLTYLPPPPPLPPLPPYLPVSIATPHGRPVPALVPASTPTPQPATRPTPPPAPPAASATLPLPLPGSPSNPDAALLRATPLPSSIRTW